MGSSSSNNSGSKGGEWVPYVYFYTNGTWLTLKTPEQIIKYFKDELKAEQEIILASEIRKYDLWYLIPGWFGNWHEYTLVETTNWYWSFEKNSDGIYVQRNKDKDRVRCYFGSVKRKRDKSEGRSTSRITFQENILKAVHWIINKGELKKGYHITKSNCHYFASLLYEAITRTCGKRRLSNTC